MELSRADGVAARRGSDRHPRSAAPKVEVAPSSSTISTVHAENLLEPNNDEDLHGGPAGTRTRDRRIKSPHSRNLDSQGTAGTWSGNWPSVLRRTPSPSRVARINLTDAARARNLFLGAPDGTVAAVGRLRAGRRPSPSNC